MSARYIIGDTRDAVAAMPDASVDLVFTSPPFLALRSYLPADHPDKGREIGSEATPAEFLSVLLDLSREWGRVLTPTGSLVVELGDTYAGSGGAGGASIDDPTERRYQGSGVSKLAKAGTSSRFQAGPGWPLAKSLCGIPTLYTWSLAYGRNLLAPDDTIDPWRIRNLVVWHRPNPPVGALGDKYRPSTSYLTVATRSPRRWFDLDAVRGPGSPNTHARTAKGVDSRPNDGKTSPDGNRDTLAIVHDTAGAPPLDAWFDTHDGDDVWNITTDPYRGSHYATFPRALARRVIESMCPLEVCRTCGEPRRRIIRSTRTKDGEPIPDTDKAIRRTDGTGRTANTGGNWRYATDRATLGWTTCDCPNPTWRPGVVLDPFAGSGTTLQVATGLGRHAIGVDIDARNADLARERCGMFLAVEEAA